ncbi:MAG: PKD domain-containing protein, partial [Bifidobacteriaceae bacterium]|nr:PKD domain-containing protein [Bifidobacteriaceae bacterium]
MTAQQTVKASPRVDFGAPTGVLEGQTPSIGVWTTETDRAIVQWRWDKGDGTAAVVTTDPNHGNVRFVDSGTFSVTVTATDTYGLTGSATHEVTVANLPPVATANTSSATVLAGNPWTPVVTVSDPSTTDHAHLTCEWDYGDGTTAVIGPPCTTTNVRAAHTYAVGQYTPTVTVTDPDGATAQASVSVTVERKPAYLSVYPVAGTQAGGQITVRAKLWDKATWDEVPDVPVEFEFAGHLATATTGPDGVAEVRLARTAGATLTATSAETAIYESATDSTEMENLGKPPADIIFTVDESSSMGFIQTALRTNLAYMGQQLAASLDYQLGLMGFGSSAHYLPITLQPATDSLADFDAAASRLRASGATEPGIDAIGEAVQPRVGLRPEAAACVVMIGDEATQRATWTVAQAAQALEDADATLFSVITPASSTQDYANLALNSGGDV